MKNIVNIILVVAMLLVIPFATNADENKEISSNGRVSFYGEYVPEKKEEVKVVATSDIYRKVGNTIPQTGDKSYAFYYAGSIMLLAISFALVRKRKNIQTTKY